MRLKKRKVFLTGLITLILTGSACLFSPESDDGGESLLWSPVDSAYKVIDNLELCYEAKNIDGYMDCLHSEFEFWLLETDWADYTGNGEIDEFWGRDIEENMTTNMFGSSNADVISLTLEGNSESPWYADSTGQTLMLVRSFNLQVYFINGDGNQEGFQASGQAVFLCKKDDDGEYQIWRWEDQSSL